MADTVAGLYGVVSRALREPAVGQIQPGSLHP